MEGVDLRQSSLQMQQIASPALSWCFQPLRLALFEFSATFIGDINVLNLRLICKGMPEEQARS
jgi:hypothetical protein